MKKLLILMLLLWPMIAMGQVNNRGDFGTLDGDFITREVMDVLYVRQDGIRGSQITLINADFQAESFLRLVNSVGAYTDIGFTASANALFNLVSGSPDPRMIFEIDSVLAFRTQLAAQYDTTIETPGLRADIVVVAIGIQAPAASGIQEMHFSADGTGWPIGATPGSTGRLSFVFHGSEAPLRPAMGRLGLITEWTAGVSPETQQSMFMRAIDDPNTTSALWRTNVKRTSAGVGTIESLFNKKWKFTQTKAGEDVAEWVAPSGAGGWKVDSIGNLVDTGSNDLLDTVDVSAHDHSGGSLGLAVAIAPDSITATELATDSVLADEIDDKVCLGMLWGECDPSTGITNYCAFSLDSGAFSSSNSALTTLVPAQIKIHSLRVAVSAPPGVGNTWTITFMNSAVATPLSCPITGNSNAACNDSNDVIVVNASNRMAIKIVPTSNPSNPAFIRYSVCIGA